MSSDLIFNLIFRRKLDQDSQSKEQSYSNDQIASRSHDINFSYVIAWGSIRGRAFACSNAGIVFSNPTQGMDVYLRLFCVCVGRGLAMG
jgi:hypothetical protein